jgi:uncharacterized protein DUF1206
MSGAWQVLARIGYTARGIVFLLIGGLSALAAIGAGQRVADGKDAFRSLLGQPFGHVLLIAIAIGLLCFAVWRLLQAILDSDRNGNDLAALVRRTVQGAAGIFYIGFAGVAASIALGWDEGGNSDQLARGWTAWLLAKPYGQWLIGAIGFGFIGSAVAIAVAGYRAEFSRRLELDKVKREIVTTLGRFGFIARAVVYVMIECFLVFAALHSHSREAKGFAGALLFIQQQPYGSVLLGLTALGLLAFGGYGVAEGACRRIDAPTKPARRRKIRLAF